jgi:glycosyltransferase involved in cell wall biosynthesis
MWLGVPDRRSACSAQEADAVGDDARARFVEEYAGHANTPVVVVIAALDEERSVGAVVRSLPNELSGLAVSCIVVDDGSGDDTSGVARDAGALVCRLERNLGQGRALQVGYSLASWVGARVIVTLDADGQFDTSEMARLVGPVASGRVDFVNGSRRLGTSHTTDRVRQFGLCYFGAVVSILSGTKITDPANGFRAFTPELTRRVPLHQAQYQTAELLMGALALGFRVVETPVTVLPRAAGATKKGSNLRYGMRFGRVVVGTWWSLRHHRADRSESAATRSRPGLQRDRPDR